MDKLKMHSINKVDENIEKIGKLFPNCITERKNANGEVEYAIDFDMLKQELSSVVVEGNEERYQFTWPDKKKSILLANAPIAKTLRPCREDSVDFDNTENLYIEGDNLDVLKLLQETYLGKIKMIYIDPPYNTGHDFVYEDDFAQSTEEYLANSGQFDDEGNRLVANTESNGRFHTDWLNMLYPRLKLAKDLLSDDGVIFISIDDNEQDNLKKIGDEIFGASNFLANIIWEKADSPRMDAKAFSTKHDFVLVYAKQNSDDVIKKDKLGEIPEHYDKIDAKGNRYYLKPLRYMGAADAREDRPNLYYPIIAPNGEEVYPIRSDGSDGRWRWSQEKFKNEKDRLEFVNGRNGWSVYTKIYADTDSETPIETIWYNKDVGSNRTAMALVKKLFEGEKPFSTPKPIELIERMIQIINNEDAIVLDFFSGSATTAHAVMDYNLKNNGNCKFIMVQMNENCEDNKAGYNNICEVGKERIRRAGAKIKEESPMTTTDLDTGFRVLKLDSSNMKNVYYNPADYELSLFESLSDNIKEDRTPEDLLFQVMLDLGALLSSKIEESTIGGKKVFNVADGFLYACFDENVTEDVITEIAKKNPYYFVMRDSSMANDSVATNFEQIFATYSPDTVRKVL